jgi:adenylate cyclase
MTSMSVTLRKVFIGTVLGLVATAAAFAATHGSLLQSLENRGYDLRVRYEAEPATPASPIVLVEINESSVRGLAPVVGRWPWPRFVHAAVIDFLKQAGAKVIAYDVLFGDREGRSTTVINGREIRGDESDQALVTAVQNAGNVVLLAEATAGVLATPAATATAEPLTLPGVTFHPGSGFERVDDVALPFHELASFSRAIGHNRLVKDTNSDAARRMRPFIETHGVAIPSLGTAAALAFLGTRDEEVRVDGAALRIGAATMPVLHEPTPAGAASTQALIRFVAPTTDATGVRSTFPTYSFFDVALSADNVASGKPPAIPASAFAGKLVFVGTTAAGLFDRYASPFDGGAAGVELHAMFADGIISGRFMRRATTPADVARSVVLGAAAGLSATLMPVALATVSTLALVGAFAVWAATAVRGGVWVAVVMPSLAAALALFGGVAWRYFVEDREKRHIRHLFGRYVSSDVIDELMSNPALAKLGGQRREMTVLFSDIRGFTTASEASTPEAVVSQLNEYFGAMVEVLFRHGGTLDKFVGDMVMGLFGAPLPDPRHADHAVLTAIEMIERLEALNVKWKTEGRPELNIGIGINSGEMIAGNIGAESAMSYTVIGDAVNLGSRLESLNKEYGTRILISDATRSRLTIPVEARFIGDVKVKGKTQAVPVYTVIAAKEQRP